MGSGERTLGTGVGKTTMVRFAFGGGGGGNGKPRGVVKHAFRGEGPGWSGPGPETFIPLPLVSFKLASLKGEGIGWRVGWRVTRGTVVPGGGGGGY